MGLGIEKKPLSPVATHCRAGDWRLTTWPPPLRRIAGIARPRVGEASAGERQAKGRSLAAG